MVEQPELDLGMPAPAAQAARLRPRGGYGGFSRIQIARGIVAGAVLLWGVWVTKTLLAPRQDHIVSVRLSELVGGYVEAQRFSGSPPQQVQAEMQAFMASLDKELQRRGTRGQIVLVGEAVLSKNVDDVTGEVRKAVYATVAEPKRASAAVLQQQLATLPQAPAASAAPLAPGVELAGPQFAAPPMSAAAPSARMGQVLTADPASMPGYQGGTDGGDQ